MIWKRSITSQPWALVIRAEIVTAVVLILCRCISLRFGIGTLGLRIPNPHVKRDVDIIRT
jgi:hypothetical protein